MKKSKISIIILVFLLVSLITTFSFASYENVIMTVESEPICTIQIDENSSFEKKMVSKKLDSKQVTMQLSVTNGEEITKPTGELVIVLDTSKSMNDIVSGTTSRKDLVVNSAKSLVSKLLKDNTSLKIAVVFFSSAADATNEGTLLDASLVSSLSNDANAINTAIDSMQATGERTDLDAGLTLGLQQYSNTADKKYMIVLTDGVPNIALESVNPYYSDTTFAKSKAKLQDVANSNIELISMLTGYSEEKRDEPLITRPDITYGQIIEQVFGTPTAPTAGKFYDIQDSQIEKTITESIYKDLLPVENTLKDITIVDYFPSEIVNNFDLAYVTEPNYGTISTAIDKTNNTITWTISELPAQKTATVQYTLTLKQNYDSAIVGKTFKTNSKIDLSYTDFDGEEQSKSSDVSPTLKLTEPTPVIPKAGTTMILTTFIFFVGIATYSLIRYLKLKNVIK